MADTCTYRVHVAALCFASATHIVIGSGQVADWRIMEEERKPEFCADHAQTVADARNHAHVLAHEARALRPRTQGQLTCAVCGERLVGVGTQIPEVSDGPVCDDCHRAANDAQLDDPRTAARPKRRKRKKAA